MSNNEFHIDRELFKRISEGDESAFASIFQNYYQGLFWHALKLLKSEFWAEEVVQEIFSQLWLIRSGLSDIENPSSYLFKMVANKALDRIRKKHLEIKMQYFISNQLNNIDRSSWGDEWDRIDRWMLEAIEKLPEQRKSIYRLKYHRGLSYQEIAEQLSITKNTVRNQMVKALESIRSYLLERKRFLIFLFFFNQLIRFLVNR